MGPTNQPTRTDETPLFIAHDEGDSRPISHDIRDSADIPLLVLPPTEPIYDHVELVTRSHGTNQSTQDSFQSFEQDVYQSLQRDAAEFQGQSSLSWQLQDLADLTADVSLASVGNSIQPVEQSWQASLSPWTLQDQTQNVWQHHHEDVPSESLPITTWELGQGTAKAFQYSPNVQVQSHGLPRRRSRYLRSPAMPIVSGTSPIGTSAAGTLVDSSMDPIQRWRNSPPETEAASLSAIANALRNNPLRGQARTSSLNNNHADFRPRSTVSFASGSSLSSGSAASASSVSRRGRVVKRTRPAKGKTADKRRFPCTFCCDSFKSKFDWARHEQSLHLSVQGWLCAPFGSVVISAVTGCSSCAYCGLTNPTTTHLEDHNSNSCENSQIYTRKDHLVQHLRSIHNVKDPPLIDSWKVEGPPIASRCGFCDLRMETWQDRIDHLVSHFRKGKTMDDWKGNHGFDSGIAARVTNAIPPYLIASESKTYAPFSAATPNPIQAEHIQQITRSAEAWTASELVTESREPTISLQDKSFPELLAFHLGRFAQHQMRLGIIPTDKMFQDEARRLQFGTVDPLDDTVADNQEWLSLFRSQHLDDSAGSQDRLP
ncbi:hypothetical protein KAF25_002004 [Fusarium avenaceum]|uniref:C2H2-type domain-containing protein n=1 Tax=Fusarium avenaceum TaxID=40199 RepID=A0A9P7KSL9_9HYPO|nr:hypothetical protein KAF25_002004 [Fusarium avenaceum]